MTLLEALSLSIPCVVTDVGGNPEIIEDNRNGRVVGSDDPVAFATAILSILENHSGRERMASEAKEIFNDRFTVKAMLTAYERCYHQ